MRPRLNRVFNNEFNKFNAMEVQETSTIASNDDFEEVSIDGKSCATNTTQSGTVTPALGKYPAFFMCKPCNIYFPDNRMLKRHLNTVHRERKSLLEQLRERVEGYIRNSTGRYVCNYCDFSSFGKTKISTHVASEHGRKVRSVAVRTPRVTVAIETGSRPEDEQEIIDFESVVQKVEPKLEPELEETLDIDMDQFEDVEEHKIEPEPDPEIEMVPDEMDLYEEHKMEPEKKEEPEFDLALEPEPEPEPESEIELVLEPDTELYEEPEPGVYEEQEIHEITENPLQEVEQMQENNIEIIIGPEASALLPQVPVVAPIQAHVDPELPLGLEHGEEELMVVPDDTADTEVILNEPHIVNDEDLHYVQEVEVTAEEAPEEDFEAAEGNASNDGQLPTGGRWPNSAATLLPEEMFRCKYCDYSASRRPTLHAHIRRKHRTLWLESTGRREDEHPMSQEQLSALGLAKREFPCQYCDYASTTRGTLVSHMRNKHPGQEVPPVVRKPLLDLRCDMCDFRTRSRRKIEVHIERKHVTELRYTCEYCGKKFKVKCDLTSHIRFQHFKTPTICDVCGKICSNTNSLHVHQKREHFKPDFECHICGRRVVSQANLDEHIRRQHEERTKYMCDQCGKVFDQPNKLRQHIMTHTGERPHTCHICKKSFARRAVFRQHFLIHTGERPYVCDICGKAFTQKPGLICHRKMHPGDKPPLPVVYIDHILKRYEKGDEEEEE